jgi:hypothetical protein
MFSTLCLAASLGAWAALGAYRGFNGDAAPDPDHPPDGRPLAAPPYHHRFPNHPATSHSLAYGRYGGYPILHGRGLWRSRAFVQGYRGYTYRGGNF